MNTEWHALAREAGTAAQHLAMGVTSLGKANYAEPARYHQVFFALSVGFERSAKLIIAIDEATKSGAFPPSKRLRSYGHALTDLMDVVEDIATRLDVGEQRPRTDIHRAILKTLTDFASNLTRYYNLELLSGEQRAPRDVIEQWIQSVTYPVLSSHYRSADREKHERTARAMDEALAPFTLVLQASETQTPITSIYEGSTATASGQVARRWERMYVLQLARFIAATASSLTNAAHSSGLDSVPYLGEFFGLFNNPDSYFRRRETWSIYGR